MSDIARLTALLADRYTVERELGEGGAATVYLARDIKHDRNVAIKVLRPDLAQTLGAERFTREIRTAANLNHPHILTVLDSGSADGMLYYVMPFAEGESLRARITREGGLPIADVIRIMREVSDALSAAHAAGVVHRDIKPDNVLLSGRHALVADFGVATANSESTGRNKITTLGVALGTPAYMAPEQAAADPHVDHRADIYALGILGYEMLTGEPPFVRRTPQEVLAAHVTEAAPAASTRRQSVPPALDALIGKCLLKQPGDRYQSADDILAELERISTPTAGTSPAAGLHPAAGTPTVKGARAGVPSMRVGAVIAIAALVLVSGWFVVKTMRGGAAADAKVVAVFPFEFSGSPDLAYLREGIVNVLESNLTGEVGPRAVASQTMIAQWKRKGGDKQGLTEDEARALARELGAGQVLRGSIVGAGSDLVISATLAAVTGGGQPVQAQVKGPADSIATLATRLAVQLLSLRVGEAAARLHSLEAVPPAALRQYLVGQQALRESRFSDAYNAFAAAIGLDSTFALAGMGLDLAQNWSLVSLGPVNGLDVAFKHRDRLGPRDLVLLEMTSPSRFAGHPFTQREASDLRERLVREIPDSPVAWYLIGDQYFHRGAAFGLSSDEAMRRAMVAFEKVLALDPGVTYVQSHVAQSYSVKNEWARARQVAESLHAPTPELILGARWHAGDSTDIARYRADLERLSPDQLIMVAVFTPGSPIADTAVAMALARSTDAGQRQALLRVKVAAYMRQGRPSAVRQAGAQLSQPAFAPGVALDVVFNSGDSLAGAEAMAGITRSLRPAPEAIAKPMFAERRPLLVAGLWASFRNDTAGLASAIARLDAMAARKDSVYQAAAAQLAADVLRLVGSAGPADRALLTRADSSLRDGPWWTTPDIRAAMNLVVARSWERAGDARRAAAAAERTIVFEPGGDLSHTAGARETGRMMLAIGDTVGAVAVWSRYLVLRGHAEPGQRKVDDDIRRTMAEIVRKKR